MTYEGDIEAILTTQTPQEVRRVLSPESLWEVALESGVG